MRIFIAWMALLCCATAHDIPSDVTVQMLLKPSPGKLQLIVRVPLGAIRDVDFPQQPEGYLDVEKLAPQLPDAARLWIANFITLEEGAERLTRPRVGATKISLPSDRTLASFDEALGHVTGPKLPNSSNVLWQHVMFDVLLEYPIRSECSDFSIRPGLEHLGARVVTALRFSTPGGAIRSYEFIGDPGLVHLDPGWTQAAARFVSLGLEHILGGIDHLLFLVCLVLPFRRIGPLLQIVTAFTVAHSVTLIASAYGLAPDVLWFPPLIETLIAASIVYMALENIARGSTVQRRWMFAFGFGLVHGFGFSFALRENLQFAGSHLLSSLLSFNLGVEIGQVLVLLALIPALALLFRYVVAERMGTIIVSALVAHTAWHWMIDRGDRLRQFHFEWRPADWAPLAMLLGALIAVAVLVRNRRAIRRTQPTRPATSHPVEPALSTAAHEPAGPQ